MLNIPDDRFAARADEHINLANSHLQDAGSDRVVASLVDAATRFYVGMWANHNVGSAEEMIARREEAIESFAVQSRRMLERHLDEYTRNYDAYTATGNLSTGSR